MNNIYLNFILDSRFKKVTPILESPDSEQTSEVFIIDSNINNRISSAPPPRYDEVFNFNNPPVINITTRLEMDEPLPVLPGSYVPYNETKR